VLKRHPGSSEADPGESGRNDGRFEKHGEHQEAMADARIVFIAALSPGSPGASARLFAESIRAKAGRLSKSSTKMYVTPDTEALPKNVKEKKKLQPA